ncbi:MAG: hypothetical protein AAFR46_02715 [Pseudomonadota bacterium]
MIKIPMDMRLPVVTAAIEAQFKPDDDEMKRATIVAAGAIVRDAACLERGLEDVRTESFRLLRALIDAGQIEIVAGDYCRSRGPK